MGQSEYLVSKNSRGQSPITRGRYIKCERVIERGTLAEEFRKRPAPDGNGTVQYGPYFKHQCWEKGKNRSVRVPAGQVAQVREHLENGHHFDELTATLEQLAIEEGCNQRAALSNIPVSVDTEVKMLNLGQSSDAGLSLPRGEEDA